ncbi:MAG: 23S rRNA (pseudouridine(1915)-N(3))-methyltransferase RlmH [Acidobacteriota bacterium]
MLKVVWPGRTKDLLLSQLVQEYAERIRHYVPFRLEETNAGRGSRPGAVAGMEGRRMLARLKSETPIVILDQEGHEMSSLVFSKWLDGRLTAGGPAGMAFLLGGHQGLSETVKARATQAISLSRMTLTHEMVRVLFLEQLYRALTIIRGENYHH